MNDKQTTRRRFLVAAITFSGIASVSPWLKTSAAWAASHGDDESVLSAMGRMARLLFPHDGLADAVYGEVIADVLEMTAADPTTHELLNQSAQALDAALNRSWFDLDEASQIEVIKKLQDEPAFASVREMVRFRVYEHPKVWKHIGYPGSSKEYGGYKNRGFNDIDWLPEEG